MSTFTKKHYEAVAQVIKNIEIINDPVMNFIYKEYVSLKFSSLFKNDNPNYNPDRFLKVALSNSK